MTHKEYADSLRLIATFFEQHEELPLPHDAATFQIFNVHDKANLLPWLTTFGTTKKKFDDSFFLAEKAFGSITMQIVIGRGQVCTRRVLGTKKVVDRIPTGYQEVEREVEIATWDCEPLLTEI